MEAMLSTLLSAEQPAIFFLAKWSKLANGHRPPLALSVDKATYKHRSRQSLGGVTISPCGQILARDETEDHWLDIRDDSDIMSFGNVDVHEIDRAIESIDQSGSQDHSLGSIIDYHGVKPFIHEENDEPMEFPVACGPAVVVVSGRLSQWPRCLSISSDLLFRSIS
eukprot:gene16092-7443_t